MDTEQDKLPPPPSLVVSMMRGFDSVANHMIVILPPVLLDLLLWLGPHLRLKTFFQPFIDRIPSLASAFPSSFPDVSSLQQLWTDMANRFNLFIILRTFPVGVTSLLSLDMPVKTPWGNPAGLDAGSIFGIFLWSIFLALMGWVLGTYYFYSVSDAAIKPEARSFWKSVKQSIFLSIIWLGFLIIFGLPALLIISVVSVISSFLGQIVLFVGALLLAWLLMPIFFSAHGIFISQMDAMRAILNSLRMIRFTLPNTGLFLLVFVVINIGLNFLWSSPSDNSWFMLVGIAGHAFVSTALLAASFIYYRDINSWLAVVFEQLQRQTTSAKV
jgi:hypothetical protein